MRPTNLATVAIALASLSPALALPPPFDGLTDVSGLALLLDRRQSSNGDSASQSSFSLPPSSFAPTTTFQSSTPTTTNSDSTGFENSGSHTTTGTATRAGLSNSTITSIANTAPAGGVNFIQPNTDFGGSQYYFVGTTATWIWNYTSLIITPAHIDIVATVSSSAGVAPPSPYTLASNLTFEPTMTFTWDTSAYASQNPLAVGLYRLEVFDADNTAGVSAFPSPGKLAPAAAFTFGVYTNIAYPAPQEFQCVTCNAAGGNMERLALGTLAGVLSITLGTVVWFTGVNGVW